MRRSWPILIVTLAAALTVGGFPYDAGAAPPDDPEGDITSLREKARQLESEIETLGARASVVLEEYRQAEEELSEADAALFTTRARVEALRREFREAESEARTHIVAIYQGRGIPDPMAFADASTPLELGARHHYATALARRDREAVDRLGVQREDLEVEERRLEAERTDFADRERALRTRHEEVAAAMQRREAALAEAEGELADLVEQERLRRQAEEERRLREELARRRAEETARRAAEEARQAGELAATTTTEIHAENVSDTGASTPTIAPEFDDPTPTSGSAPPVHPRAGEAVDAAMSKIGTPYVWGGNGPGSFDCSGLTSWAWAAVGVDLPRSSSMQKQALPPVSLDAIQPGDLLFFGNPVHHVGMYIGGGKMVNAPYTGSSVRVDSIYRSDMNGIGRPG